MGRSDMKRWLRRIPLITPLGKLGKSIFSHVMGIKDPKTLEQLNINSYPQGAKIKEALRLLKQQELPKSEQQWIANIEQERKYLLSRNEPLIDGTLGDGGIYDNGATIKMACQVSQPLKSALMLYLITRVLKPQRVIELGTNVGLSSAYIMAALDVNGQNGTLTTLDSSLYRQKLAKEVHSNLGLNNVTYVGGLFADTLRGTLNKLGSIDFAFIDGHHQYKPTLDYFGEIFRFSTVDAVFVFDDIRWSDGMKKAWSELQDDGRLGLLVDLYSVGICVRAHEPTSRRFVLSPIYNAFH